VKNLAGEGPKIRLDATSSGTAARFEFFVTNDIFFLDDLEITGDGTQAFLIGGNLRDYDAPRSVKKTGTSIVTLAGHNTFRGNLAIQGGQVKLTATDPRFAPVGAIDGANSIVIGGAGSFVMESGFVKVPLIDNSLGGDFQFNGGELRITDFLGHLVNQGGDFSPGASPAISTITGNYVQQPAGKLTIEIDGTTPGTGFDQVLINGTATLGGTLQVNLLDGFVPQVGNSFEILRAFGGLTGTFANASFAGMPGITWRLAYEPLAVRLFVDAVATLPGDFNLNGVVDAADYALWRHSFGATGSNPADADGNGTVDNDDYAIWRANFGRTISASATGSTVGVPEPATAFIAVFFALLGLFSFRTKR
jgi:hypothetical protein